eukprot:8460781-Karenia_brevis.AAC.1
MSGCVHKSCVCPERACVVQALSHIRDSFFELGSPPPDTPSGKGALCELLASSSVYSFDRQDIQSFAEERISWPSEASEPVVLANHLPKADSERLIDW